MRRIIFREKVKFRSDSNYGTLEDGFRKYCGIQDGCTFKEFLGDAGFLHIANTLDRHKIKNRLSNFIYIYLCLVLLFLFISFVAFNISPIVSAASLLLGLSIFICTLWFVDDLQKTPQFEVDEKFYRIGGVSHYEAMEALVLFQKKLGSGDISLYVKNDSADSGYRKAENISRFNIDGGFAWLIKSELRGLPIKTVKVISDEGDLYIDLNDIPPRIYPIRLLRSAVNSPKDIKYMSSQELLELRGLIRGSGMMDPYFDSFISVFEVRMRYFDEEGYFPQKKDIAHLLRRLPAAQGVKRRTVNEPTVRRILNGDYDSLTNRLVDVLKHVEEDLSN